VEEAAILAYLSDGRRLKNDNVRELAGVQDQVCGSSMTMSRFQATHIPSVYLRFQ